MLHKFRELTSTQIFLKRNLDVYLQGDGVYAEKQTNGYGRTGLWESSDKNIYYSSIIPNNENSHLAIICAMHSFIASFTNDAEIKVPNDLYVNGKKIGGFLIEIIEDVAICGIGINVFNDNRDYTSLNQITGEEYDIDILVKQLHKTVFEFLKQSTSQLEEYYQKSCKMLGKYVEFIVLSDYSSDSGIVSGLDSTHIFIDGRQFHQMEIKILNKRDSK